MLFLPPTCLMLTSLFVAVIPTSNSSWVSKPFFQDGLFYSQYNMEVYYTDIGREGHSSFLQFHGCLRSLPLKILFSISGIEMGGGLRLYWFQKCSLSLEFVEEGVEAPLEFIEDGVKDPVEIEEGLENRVESYDAFRR